MINYNFKDVNFFFKLSRTQHVRATEEEETLFAVDSSDTHTKREQHNTGHEQKKKRKRIESVVTLKDKGNKTIQKRKTEHTNTNRNYSTGSTSSQLVVLEVVL